MSGYALDGAADTRSRPGRAGVIALNLATVFAGALGLALVAHFAIAWLGAPLGIPVAVVLATVALLPRGPVHALYRALALPQQGAAEPRARRPATPPSVAGARA